MTSFDRTPFEDVEPALSLLRECLESDSADGGELLSDDDVYFWAADALTGPEHEAGWSRLAQQLDGLAAYRAAVLAHGCTGDFRGGFELVFLGELALGEAA